MKMESKDKSPIVEQSKTAPLPLEAQKKIGKRLQDVYNHLLIEPLPDKFKKLLEELAKLESEQ